MAGWGRRSAPILKEAAYVDYKDLDLLQKLVTPQGKILGRKRIGCDAKTQHRVKRALHRARYIALMPYGG